MAERAKNQIRRTSAWQNVFWRHASNLSNRFDQPLAGSWRRSPQQPRQMLVHCRQHAGRRWKPGIQDVRIYDGSTLFQGVELLSHGFKERPAVKTGSGFAKWKRKLPVSPLFE